MTREEKIDILIRDRIWEWVDAHNTNLLEEWLIIGFKGYENLTDEELDESIEEINDKVEEIQTMLAEEENENE